MKRLATALIATGLILGATTANAWMDNFDGYTNGQVLNGIDGWSGWDNTASAAGIVSNAMSASAPNSLAIIGTSDAVKEYVGVDKGQWTFKTDLYIPGLSTGTTFFIMMDQYAVGGTLHWAVQLNMNLDTGIMTDDLSGGGETLALVKDQWTELRVEMDFDADTRSIYYNNNLLSTASWTRDVDGLAQFQAIDLFGNGADVVYYDNVDAVPEPATLTVLGLGALALMRRRRR